jgi:hypothetical protein
MSPSMLRMGFLLAEEVYICKTPLQKKRCPEASVFQQYDE